MSSIVETSTSTKSGRDQTRPISHPVANATFEDGPLLFVTAAFAVLASTLHTGLGVPRTVQFFISVQRLRQSMLLLVVALIVALSPYSAVRRKNPTNLATWRGISSALLAPNILLYLRPRLQRLAVSHSGVCSVQASISIFHPCSWDIAMRSKCPKGSDAKADGATEQTEGV